jgi:N-acetylglucosamine-6-sulfatase
VFIRRHLTFAFFLGSPPLDAIMLHHVGLAVAAIAVASSATTPYTQPNEPSTAKTSKPNFIFIMTDDQDLHMESLKYMPAVQEHFGNGGTFHQKHYCTVSQCCPSRVSLLTGKAAHNTNVTAVTEPYGTFITSVISCVPLLIFNDPTGGYPKFISEGWNDKYLPVWLQDAGYNTYYTGKFMNAHTTTNYNKPFPKGWNGTDCKFIPISCIGKLC